MSGRHKRQRQEPSDQSEGLWINTEERPEGGFYVVVSIGGDRIWRLDADACLNYVLACTMAAQQAEYDAAVLKQMTSLGLEPELVAQMIAKDLRMDRPSVPDAAPGLRYAPGVTAQGKPFLKIELDGEGVGQLDLDQLREHSMSVLEAPVAADLDSAYKRALVGLIGLDAGRASNVVADLANHRWKP